MELQVRLDRLVGHSEEDVRLVDLKEILREIFGIRLVLVY